MDDELNKIFHEMDMYKMDEEPFFLLKQTKLDTISLNLNLNNINQLFTNILFTLSSITN